MRLIPTLFAMSLSFAVPAAAGPVSIDDVRDLAFAKGIVKIEEVRLNHHGVWKVEGEDAGGHEIKMQVDAASGPSSSLSGTISPPLAPRGLT